MKLLAGKKNLIKKKLSELADETNSEISKRINNKELLVFKNLNLNEVEINRLYRWSLYIGINIFIERLVRSIYDKEKNYGNIEKKIQINKYDFFKISSYHKTISAAASAYYNNELLNDCLLNEILSAISDDKLIFKKKFKILQKKISFYNYFLSIYNLLTRRSLELISKFSIIFFPTNTFYEGDKFFSKVFKINQRFPNKINKLYNINNTERSKLRKIYGEVFIDIIATNLKIENEKQSNKLKLIFQEWIDKSIPISCLEGLDEKFIYYSKLIEKYKINKIISYSGYWYNENIKVFSILLKRKGGLIVGMHDGLNNYFDYLAYDNIVAKHYKSLSQILLTDKYIFWGISDKLKYYQKEFANYNVQILNFGSTYLNKISKYKLQKKKKSVKIKVLYISGPYRRHMANLEEITPEKNKIHKSNVVNFIKDLLSSNKNINLTYKTFQGVDTSSDLIFSELKNYFKEGRAIITTQKPIKIMQGYDFVIFDMLSTGFGEASNQNVTSLIFSSQFDYNCASRRGKNINEKLEKSKILFYDSESGLEAFLKLKKFNFQYDESAKKTINEFKKDMAYPISNAEFLKKFNKL